MAKLVSQPRPVRVEQPILNETSAPSAGVTFAGVLLIALLALGAVAVVIGAFQSGNR